MWKALELPKLSNKLSLKESGGNLESKKSFQRQSVTKYLRLTLVFMWNSALWENLIANFEDFFASIKKFHFDRETGH